MGPSGSGPELEFIVPTLWDEKQRKRGSPLNDWFRWWHKKLGPGFHGADLDLLLNGRDPAGIAAVLDFKGPDEEPLGFSHVQVYNGLMKRHRIYVVELQNDVTWRDVPVGHNGQTWMQRLAEVVSEDDPRFLVSRYLGGDWRPNPPKVARTRAIEIVGLDQWREWERKVRRAWACSPLACRQGGHRWLVAGRHEAPWGKELTLKCGDCGLSRFWDQYGEAIPEPAW